MADFDDKRAKTPSEMSGVNGAAASPADVRRDVSTRCIDEAERKFRANFATNHPPHGAVVAQKYLEPVFGPDAPWWDHLDALKSQIRQTKQGDLSGIEAMLVTQAHALDAIFTSLAARASDHTARNPGAADTYLRLALKAQAQCRATLQALAEIKNPRPVAFVRQANIANGPQQVNNETMGRDGPQRGRTRAEDFGNPTNELLEADRHARMDIGATGAASGNDSQMAALGTVNGTCN